MILRRKPLALAGLAAVATGLGLGTLTTAATPVVAAPTPTAAVARASVRRLNEQQYVRSIHDIFGPTIKIPGRFEPPVREGGLLAIGDGKVAISPAGFEQYELRAREIASQVLAPERRGASVGCTPADPAKFDRDCAAAFVAKYGRLLYRRPLAADEASSTLAIAEVAARQGGSFYRGLELALARLLVSPNFIFRVENFDIQRGGPQLNDYAIATRISFLLWDAPPDAALIDAAASGALRSESGVQAQVDRLIASPRFTDGVRAFFSDMFGYEQFDGVSKDQAIFPIYTSQLAKDAKEQVLRTIVQVLVDDRSDYRELFTTPKTFMNRGLGGLYNVAVPATGFDGWAPYTFGKNDNRAGILTLAAFLMLDLTHEGRTSPTIRGRSVRELLLCQTVPLPPGNVNFALVQDVHNPLLKTARGRLTAHRDDPVCAGCHAITDPIGLSLENYDGVGAFRTHENGVPIDASGTFEGKPYANVIELEKLLRTSSTPAECVAQRVYEYSQGRAAVAGDEPILEQLKGRFAAGRYQFPALMRAVALSPAFRSAPPTVIASN